MAEKTTGLAAPLDELVSGADNLGKDRDLSLAGSDTVTIGCKMPNGLILRTYDWVEKEEDVHGVTRKYKISQPTGEEVVLNGNALNVAAVMGGYNPEHQIVGGYALTMGVSKVFWDRWYDANKTTELVKNGIVFAAPKHADVQAIARENVSRRSGLEPLDPNDLPIDVRGRRRTAGGSVSGIEQGTRS